MTTTHDPIDLVCGDTWEFIGTLNDIDGVPMNLAGATITWKLDNVLGTSNILTLAIGSGIAITDMASATIMVKATPVQTAAIVAGNYIDWLRIVLATGEAFTEWTGLIRAAPIPA